MRILLLADIHANYQALRATLEAFPTVDEVWCLGDLVACGPCPEECITLVRQTCRYVIKGNHDAVEGMSDPLSHDAREYLRKLPETLRVTIDTRSYMLVHGSPLAPMRGAFWPQMPTQALRQAIADCDAECILAGHTHMAMSIRADEQLIVNPGTIGQPRDGDYRAQCALIEDGAFRFARVAYDLDALTRDYARSTVMPESAKKKWLHDTCRGIVEEHGLQPGPFTGLK